MDINSVLSSMYANQYQNPTNNKSSDTNSDSTDSSTTEDKTTENNSNSDTVEIKENAAYYAAKLRASNITSLLSTLPQFDTGGISAELIQNSMTLTASGKAYAALLRAQETGSVREKPNYDLASEKYFPSTSSKTDEVVSDTGNDVDVTA